MLQLKGITKIYKTGGLVQQALNNVSLSLRDNEFVAILGQSGSGKTTMLNIIGGLDRYNDGDLIINGVSTKRYNDRNWDSYRNHTVGFVFQSYNLIPHQTILKNVELALTIGGVSKSERTKRATEALRKVGLSDHIKKKPSQLSGGQMQRVAIARALVNDPDILLADEPTGALDSETSIQVMDLLKEVAKDRLVVMVTHNPELAEEYATRIVRLKDGQITDDSNPYNPEEDEAVAKAMGKSSMSLLTSLALSFNNLWTKKARTILVSFAGSIGIIGIAMILAMSNGANQYIHNVEEDSLKDYPLTISSSSFDLTSMYAGSMGDLSSLTDRENDDKVSEMTTFTSFASGIKSNDLKSLKAHFESELCNIQDYVQTIEYNYDVVPYIYKETKDGKYRQVNPDNTFSSLGLSSTAGTSSIMSNFYSVDTFFSMPKAESLYKDNFELKAGKWPEKYDECVVSLTSSGKITDVTLYVLGLKDPDELDKIVQNMAEGKNTETSTELSKYDAEDFLGIEFKVLPASELYTYDDSYKVWSDRSTDSSFMTKTLNSNGETLKIVGVIQATEDSSSSSMLGIGYHYSLTDHIIEQAAESDIVKAQLADKDKNVFTGKSFDDENKDSSMNMSSLFSVNSDALSNAFNFSDSNMDFSNLDLSSLDFSSLDLGSAVSADTLGALMPELSNDDIKTLLKGININLTADTLESLFTELLDGYQKYSADDKRTDLSALPSALISFFETDEAKDIIRSFYEDYISAHSSDMIKEEDVTEIAVSYINGYPIWLSAHGYEETDYSHISDYVNSDEAAKILQDGAEKLREKLSAYTPTDEEISKLTSDIVSGYEKYADEHSLPSASYLLSSFTSYLQTDTAQAAISKAVGEVVDASGLEESISKYSDIIGTQMGVVMQSIFSAMSDQIGSALQSTMSTLMSGVTDSMTNLFSFNTDSLADLFKSEMSAAEIKDLMTSMLSSNKTTYESNLGKLGYADPDSPSSITIYPLDFDSKTEIKKIISDYNKTAKANGEDDKVIRYTDVVDTLMGSVSTIINAISYVLIAFVAISLVVSSIMIGVITYISVLERKKEIGILRAIGASKRNISQVFNAETFIIGALAGVIGIGITELLILPVNLILHALTGQQNVSAILPPVGAIVLIILSIGLTLLGGLIPSRKAAKSDPVSALRSE